MAGGRPCSSGDIGVTSMRSPMGLRIAGSKSAEPRPERGGHETRMWADDDESGEPLPDPPSDDHPWIGEGSGEHVPGAIATVISDD